MTFPRVLLAVRLVIASVLVGAASSVLRKPSRASSVLRVLDRMDRLLDREAGVLTSAWSARFQQKRAANDDPTEAEQAARRSASRQSQRPGSDNTGPNYEEALARAGTAKCVAIEIPVFGDVSPEEHEEKVATATKRCEELGQQGTCVAADGCEAHSPELKKGAPCSRVQDIQILSKSVRCCPHKPCAEDGCMEKLCPRPCPKACNEIGFHKCTFRPIPPACRGVPKCADAYTQWSKVSCAYNACHRDDAIRIDKCNAGEEMMRQREDLRIEILRQCTTQPRCGDGLEEFLMESSQALTPTSTSGGGNATSSDSDAPAGTSDPTKAACIGDCNSKECTAAQIQQQAMTDKDCHKR